MEPLYFVMAIMSCGDDGDDCQQARIAPTRYQSAAQCRAAMTTVLQSSADLAYPVIQAACQQRGMAVAERGMAPRG